VELSTIDDMPSRRQIFATLLARKRADLSAPALGADPEFDRLLRDEKWSGDPLFLMMAGLVAGAVGVKNALALTRTDLATNIAQRELDRIGAVAAGATVDSNNRRHPGFLAKHTAVLATLCQGLSLEDARSLMAEESKRVGSGAEINDTLVALRDGLPGAGDGPEIAPVLPDIVGEAAIMLWLGSGGVLPGLGIETEPSIHCTASKALGRTSQVLVRTAQDFAAAERDEPIRWLDVLAQAQETDLGALIVIANELPLLTTALRELAVGLTRLIVEKLRIAAAGELDEGVAETAHALLGAWLANLGIRLSNLGRREEALAASQEAVDIYRRLAQTRPDAFLPDLAMSLNNRGIRLSNLGRREEALAASQEAVDIYRRLAQTRPDAFLPDLAMSLGAQGEALSQAERHADSIGAFREGLAIIAPFVERHAGAFGDLARALGRNYISACEKAGIASDTALLERVAQALGGGADADEAAVER
jgi:hypothetical protein